MPDYSVITCVSKPDVYQSCLLNSISQCRKHHSIEIIPILNEDGRYSASNALNIGIDTAKSDILIFAHQDIKLLGQWFDKLCNIIAMLDATWAILGAAGISLDYGRSDIGKWGGAEYVSTVAVGSVWEDDSTLHEPPYWDGVKDPTLVHCVDECLFVLRKSTYLRFDIQFNGFHQYAADLSLQARSAGFQVYAADLPIIHYGKFSSSLQDSRYWEFLRFLHYKWSPFFPELLGTHMHWSTTSKVADDGSTYDVPEITSYIPMYLESGEKVVEIRSASLGKVEFDV